MKTLLLLGAIALSINVFAQSKVKIVYDLSVSENLGGQMTWDEAKKACADYGIGWRLPTKREIKILYKNKDKIGGFYVMGYWSSTEGNSSLSLEDDDSAYVEFFSIGRGDYQLKRYSKHYVRAVRDAPIPYGQRY